MKYTDFLLLFFLSSAFVTTAQDLDSLHSNRDRPTWSESDTLSIFALIDSLLSLEEPRSELAIRLSYNSNLIAAGRTLGIENFGLSSGASYYHKKGFYGDVSGFWSGDFNPSYYLTVATVGYSRIFNKYFSAIASYDRYFYNIEGDPSSIPYTQSLSVTPSLDAGILNVNLGYSFFFGNKYVHRLLPALGVTFQKRKFLGVDRISFFPTVSVLAGNEVFTTIEFIPPQSPLEALQNIRKFGMRYSMVEVTRNEFGVMNYALTLPLSLSEKAWDLVFSYSYNIPRTLPSESVELEKSGFLSISLAYTFSLGGHKKPWE